MTCHVPKGVWNSDGKIFQEAAIDILAQAVIANKQYANERGAKYIPTAFAILSPGDAMIATVAGILEQCRDDEEVREAVLEGVAASFPSASRKNAETTLRAVIARVIELEES